MNKSGIIDLVIDSDIKFAKIVNVPVFKTNEEVAAFVESLKDGDKINNTILDINTGEIFLTKNQKVNNYDIYSIPKLIRGEQLNPKKIEPKDPREVFLSIDNMKKYYNFQSKGSGTYIIFRSDKKPFKEYDEMNISGFIDDIDDIDPNAKLYVYDSGVEDFEEGKRYYKLVPKSKNKQHLLENFNDYFNIKNIKLREFFEDYAEHQEAYDMYDPDADIPQEIIKKDKSKMTDNDIETIQKWLETQDFGKAEVDLTVDKGVSKIDKNNFMISFPL